MRYPRATLLAASIGLAMAGSAAPPSPPPHVPRRFWGRQSPMMDAVRRRWGFRRVDEPTWLPLPLSLIPRGGDADSSVAEATATAGEETTATANKEELSLDERVHAAMRRLGLDAPGDDDVGGSGAAQEQGTTEGCEGGVCSLPSSTAESSAAAGTDQVEEEAEDVHVIAERIASDMEVDRNIVLAAIGATYADGGEAGAGTRRVNEAAARALIQSEIDAIKGVSEESDEVKQLVSEGHDPFLSRRALAFAEMNVDDARAILIADEEDEEAERKQREHEEAAAAAAEAEEAEEMKTVTVNANFDPAAPAPGASAAAAAGLGLSSSSQQQQQQQQQQTPQGMPGPAKKSDVVFDAASKDLQRLIMESPVPVLLDVYADWCGPCKALTPALEQMAVKAGGMFRLVKINTDNEKSVSSALEVTALPTIFGVRDGKIVNSFQGMPRDEQFMRDFMTGLLMPGGTFNPPVSAEQQRKFDELSSKLAKVAGAASFSFSARERLQDRTASRLDELVDVLGGEVGMADAEDSAKVIRSLLSNVIKDPYGTKYRRVNLKNKVIDARIGRFPCCVSILKSVGFAPENGEEAASALVLGSGKKVVNIAPLVVARDCIDKWIDQNRYQIAAAGRRRRDEVERARIAAEAEAEAARRAEAGEDEEDEEGEDDVDPDACSIKIRMDGKKKVHDVNMDGNDPLRSILDALPVKVAEGQVVQLTCAARRLVVVSTDSDAMDKTLREHGMFPAASIVAKVADESGPDATSPNNGSSLAKRAGARKAKKKGSHTMQSVGIYAKDDNAKGELIDGGGGVWFEHDVTDDEEEKEAEGEKEESNGSSEDDGDAPDG